MTLGYRVDKTAFSSREEAEEAIQRAREAMLEDKDPDAVAGVHVFIKWRNPDNANERHSNWKTSDDPDQSPQGAVNTLAGMLLRMK